MTNDLQQAAREFIANHEFWQDDVDPDRCKQEFIDLEVHCWMAAFAEKHATEQIAIAVEKERQRMFPVLLDIARHRTRGHNAFKIWFEKEFATEIEDGK